jgi:predicted aconitase with swiveling domain
MGLREFRGRVLVPGEASGEAVVVEKISFYGDVDPQRGVLREDGRPIGGKVLVVRKSRGSTVGSYVIYSLKVNGVAPLAILMERAEPIVVAGCVLAEIPLIDSLPQDFFMVMRDGQRVRVLGDGRVLVEVDSFKEGKQNS